MWLAKMQQGPQLEPEIVEVKAVRDYVSFDGRRGWVLINRNIGARPRRQTLAWIHPGDVFVWWLKEWRM